MYNSVYGKSMESLRKHVNVELVNTKRRVKKALAKSTCKNFSIINDDLVMVQFTPNKIVQNKHIYTGFVVMELSKVLMYESHYKHIQGQHGDDRARLLFTDTNSLCYQIQRTCVRTWLVTSRTTTTVHIPKPTLCTVQPTPRSSENLRMKPTTTLLKN